MGQGVKNDIASTKEFIELWVRFDQICKAAMEKGDASPEEETAFLETKSVLARKFQLLVDSLTIDGITVDRTYDVINEIHSLKNISALSEHALRNLENNWHDTYISLNRLLGHLEALQQRPQQPHERVVVKAGKNFARLVMFIIVLLILAAIGVFLAYIFGAIKQ